jgi:hypothetical protein
MKKYAFAACFAVVLATPVLAAEQFYVALDTSTKQCHVMNSRPDGATQKMVGSGAYKSEADAESAIQKLSECNT